MKRFCCGFAFDTATPDLVLLIKKKKPEWQAELLNGVGGHVEFGETALDAMIREFHEEAGVLTTDWRHVVSVHDPGEWHVSFFTTHMFLSDAHSPPGGETLYIVSGVPRKHRIVPNLAWLIPLCRDTAVRHALVSSKLPGE